MPGQSQNADLRLFLDTEGLLEIEELEQISRKLFRELKEVGLEKLEYLRLPAPEGSRSLTGVMAFGSIAILLNSKLITKVVELTCNSFRRKDNVKIDFEINGKKVQIQTSPNKISEILEKVEDAIGPRVIL